MKFLFHFDSFCAAVRRHPLMVQRINQHQGSLFLAAPTITSLELWLVRYKTPLRHTQTAFAMLLAFTIVVLDEPIAHRAARLENALAAQRHRLQTIPLFVAATALEHGLTLVTHETQRFAPVPGLTLADWQLP